jgi:diguanylate cyclase (GGDEF)-like protein
VSGSEIFAYMFIDIDNFKAFNDLYGHQRGDRLILGTAEILSRVLEELGGENDFLGHVGGDDFIVLCDVASAGPIGEAIAKGFDGMIGEHLDPRERESGCLEVAGRTGTVEQHRITSITVAVVSTPDQAISHAGDISARAAEVKRHAKAQARRGERAAGSFVVWERRGSGAA